VGELIARLGGNGRRSEPLTSETSSKDKMLAMLELYLYRIGLQRNKVERKVYKTPNDKLCQVLCFNLFCFVAIFS
jgi:hypothetical protein